MPALLEYEAVLSHCWMHPIQMGTLPWARFLTAFLFSQHKPWDPAHYFSPLILLIFLTDSPGRSPDYSMRVADSSVYFFVVYCVFHNIRSFSSAWTTGHLLPYFDNVDNKVESGRDLFIISNITEARLSLKWSYLKCVISMGVLLFFLKLIWGLFLFVSAWQFGH